MAAQSPKTVTGQEAELGWDTEKIRAFKEHLERILRELVESLPERDRRVYQVVSDLQQQRLQLGKSLSRLERMFTKARWIQFDRIGNKLIGNGIDTDQLIESANRLTPGSPAKLVQLTHAQLQFELDAMPERVVLLQRKSDQTQMNLQPLYMLQEVILQCELDITH